jgi:putative tricarboxylic transport membrane protein
MDSLGLLMDGFATALTPQNLAFALLGVLLGTMVGILPGIGPAMTVALLLPVTYGVEPVSAFIMFAGIYYGGMYGGSTTSILLNTPGESASVMTALEGNLMAKRGRGAQALATAAIGSFVAGTIATAALVLLAPQVVKLAVSFGPADYFALMVLAFIMVSTVLGSSVVRGISTLAIGLAIGLIGIDVQTGQARFTLGVPQLLDGIDVVIVAVGLFAVGEALWVASRLRNRPGDVVPVGRPWMGREDWSRSWRPWLRGTVLGFPLGALPAGGAEIPTFLSYSIEKRLAGRRGRTSEFGVLVPLLTLGLPTSATAAVLIAAFEQYGLHPGPLLFAEQPKLVWGLIASLFIGNAMLLVINLPLAPAWTRLLQIPRPLLYAGIVLFAALGVYSVNGSAVDLVILYALGLLGFTMRRFGLPVAPAIIGVILGPLAEKQLRRALAISDGDYSTLVSSPIAISQYVVAALLLLGPVVARLVARRRRGPVTPERDGEVHEHQPVG